MTERWAAARSEHDRRLTGEAGREVIAAIREPGLPTAPAQDPTEVGGA
ncbi:MAG: hypothetical protein OZSIB_3007 [Candidatus Ozemobacter sibiricus]|uniref:Uncharacterized protein n=1 Tax=Candidatus Ozemobacter sibiricus TaxID=2268124 RepID=A0A367ZRB5_9BACT|nr:MAG: hypothetical protein OZSIB_3007 [Candidatus Ozemobacter sibiricus]